MKRLTILATILICGSSFAKELTPAQVAQVLSSAPVENVLRQAGKYTLSRITLSQDAAMVEGATQNVTMTLTNRIASDGRRLPDCAITAFTYTSDTDNLDFAAMAQGSRSPLPWIVANSCN